MQHLENLVLSFAQKRFEHQGTPQISLPTAKQDATHHHSEWLGYPPGTEAARPSLVPEGKVLDDSPGTILVEDFGTSYIDAAHWRAILEDVCFRSSHWGSGSNHIQIEEVKGYFREDDELSEDSSSEPETFESSHPPLLFGLGKHASKEELLSDIPSRAVANRLISRYFNSGDPSLSMSNPTSTSSTRHPNEYSYGPLPHLPERGDKASTL
jgi:hypothetical protein